MKGRLQGRESIVLEHVEKSLEKREQASIQGRGVSVRSHIKEGRTGEERREGR